MDNYENLSTYDLLKYLEDENPNDEKAKKELRMRSYENDSLRGIQILPQGHYDFEDEPEDIIDYVQSFPKGTRFYTNEYEGHAYPHAIYDDLEGHINQRRNEIRNAEQQFGRPFKKYSKSDDYGMFDDNELNDYLSQSAIRDKSDMHRAINDELGARHGKFTSALKNGYGLKYNPKNKK